MGEKMTDEEVNEIFSLIDTNKDGKLDYAEVSLEQKPTYHILQTHTASEKN